MRGARSWPAVGATTVGLPKCPGILDDSHTAVFGLAIKLNVSARGHVYFYPTFSRSHVLSAWHSHIVNYGRCDRGIFGRHKSTSSP